MAIENIEQGTLPAHIKAVIALTSWKKRINTVGLTIFNLRCVCGRDFHIVLTLAEEEFPGKESELPEDLMRMNRVGIFEILWVKKNYKSFKKTVFTQNRYKSIPIISADDGCIYTYNYASILYGAWQRNPKSIIGFKKFNMAKIPCFGSGYGVIYPPYCFNNHAIRAIEHYGSILNQNPNDDRFIGNLCYLLHIPLLELTNYKKTFIDIDKEGLTNNKSILK